MTGTYRIAERNIHIDSIHNGIHKLCKDYAFEGDADISVSVEQDDIDKERVIFMNSNSEVGENLRTPPDSYLETLAIYRKIAVALLDYDTFLFHGSAIELDGETYLFTAKSGTGKSTHTRLWRELYGDRAVMINDDKPLIRIDGDKAVIYGTPWDGKHRLSTNKSSPLKAVCLLERGEENKIYPIDGKEAFPKLLVQTYRPGESVEMIKTLGLLDRLCKCAKLYRLECNMDIEAAKVSYEGMK